MPGATIGLTFWSNFHGGGCAGAKEFEYRTGEWSGGSGVASIFFGVQNGPAHRI